MQLSYYALPLMAKQFQAEIKDAIAGEGAPGVMKGKAVGH